MKQVKLGIAALSVIVTAATTQAFKVAHKSTTTKAWFAYTSTGTSAASYQNEANYSKISSRSTTCRTNNQVCEIFASIITISTSPLVQRPHLSVLSTFGSSVATYNEDATLPVKPSIIDGVSVDFLLQD